MDFNVIAMKTLAAEDKYIEFFLNDLTKRNSDVSEEEIWRIIFDTNVVNDHLYLDVYSNLQL
ncbi:hypothetical protein M3936_19685 [Sutcliffiella horikoshii]|uniref:hypothetical protein n=1 Tax=Sutcliffiella horikoshii TaxID=79883 RepID=UPI00203CC1BD|nr:hypothetical protein [Sutcliffiella horikoshii]MCM3619797.1 hypothetical protein [Sutcliffiella horikoshii]